VPAVTIATLLGSADRVIRLTRSVRDFAGPVAGAPVLCFSPEDAASDPADRERIEAAGARVVPFRRAGVPPLPFAAKAAAAAHAESDAGARLVVWLDDDTLVVAPPAFVLPDGIALACRPVHHRNIGVPAAEPLDPFWRRVFEVCGVPEGRDRTMVSHAGEAIHAYLNAGCFAVEARRGLLQAWRDRLAALPADPVLAEWCARSEPHAVFAHQALFTGVMLAALGPEEVLELGPEYNYPLHLHHQVPAECRPAGLDELVTVRCEDLLDVPRHDLPLLDPLRDWLAETG